MAGNHSLKATTTSASSRRTKSPGAQTKPTSSVRSRNTEAVVRRASVVEGKPNAGTATITAQAIAEAAYFLWLQRGGDELTNWLEAEAALNARTAPTATGR